MMADAVKQILMKPIQLADQVTKLADDAHSSASECSELKCRTERLAALLRQAARADLYERPARRIMDDTEQVLEKALSLVCKCRANGLLKRMFTIIPAMTFRKMNTFLDNSIGDVSWLLRVSVASDDHDDEDDMHLGLPPIAQNDPILFLIWEHIATLHTGSLNARADAAASLLSLASDNERFGKLIIEEEGVGPLLRLVKEGRVEEQKNAARAIGLLGRDPESVDQMVIAGVCSVFSKVLKESPMKVQAMVAWAVSELAENNPKCQDVFSQNNVVRFLVGHLAFETVQEHSKYTIPLKVASLHSVVMANKINKSNITEEDSLEQPGQVTMNQMHNVVHSTMAATGQLRGQSSSNNAGNGRQQHVSLAGASIKGREFEDQATKAELKAMAALALWKLSKGNSGVCKSITESKALLCFAVLLANGEKEVQYNSAMALKEICLVAEVHAELRRSAFKPTSPTARAVVDQLVRIVERADYNDLLVPCITALGCLARTFRATEKRIIAPLVRLLEDGEGDVIREAAIALTKFACADNYLHLDHCKAIINAKGVKHLVQLVYFGEQVVKTAALILLSNIALHVPESEELAQTQVLTVLEWASKQGYLIQDRDVDEILPEAKARLELYQSRGSRGFH